MPATQPARDTTEWSNLHAVLIIGTVVACSGRGGGGFFLLQLSEVSVPRFNWLASITEPV